MLKEFPYVDSIKSLFYSRRCLVLMVFSGHLSFDSTYYNMA